MSLIVYATAFLTSVGWQLVYLALPFLVIYRFKSGNFELGLLAAGGAGSYVLTSFFSGRISENLSIRIQLPAAMFALAAAYTTIYLAPSFAVVFAVSVVNGVLTGLLWAPLEGVLSRLSGAARMRRNMARYNVAWTIGLAFGSFLFSVIHPHGEAGEPVARATVEVAQKMAVREQTPSRPTLIESEKGPFETEQRRAFFGGSALAIVTGTMLLFLRAPHARGFSIKADPSDPPPADETMRRFFLLTAWSGLFAAYVGVSAVRQLFPKLVTELNISTATTGHIYGAGLIAQAVAMAAMGLFARWHYRTEPFYLSEVGLIAGTMLIAVGNSSWVFAAGHIMLGGSMAVLYSCSLYYSMADARRAHHNTAIHESVIGTGLTTPLVLGYLADRFHQTRLSFFIAGGAVLLFLAIHLAIFARRKVLTRPNL
ncbi:MFS transporter [Candidatus Sumerlaeota bacterium]|nr:MFS transporter [Candidatus Sumerlaeota bacterium]